MQKLLSVFLSLLLLLPTFTPAYAAAVKSSNKNQQKSKSSKPKKLDQVYGKAGVQNESKSAMINVDALSLQNYANVQKAFNFETYDRVSLKSAILESLSKSYIVKGAKEKVIQSEIALKDAYAAYLPLLDFQYSNKYTRNFKTGDEKTDSAAHAQIDDENYGFRVRQSLYSGGATALKIKSLKYKFEEAKRKYLIVLEQNIQKAIQAYFGVLFNYKNVKVNEKNMEKLDKILEITQVKYDSGALSIGDLSAVKANIANASGNLIKVKSALADAVDFYHYTLGDDFKNTYPYQENFTITLDPIEQVYEDIVQNNLSLINYRLNIESTKYKLLNIKASFKPKVDLELSYKNVLDKEDFKANEESVYAKVTLSYSIYNGGKDSRKALQAYSSLRELKYRYEEEIKKIKWSTSKLYNSITSLDKTIISTVEEVEASNEMVNAYWEGFQLGEQDLQVLLQGQRQLNSAELDLLKYKQDYLTNLFKLIKDKGQLSKYFGIDPNSPDFLDFTNTEVVDPITHIDLTTISEEINTTQKPKELNATIDEYLEVVKEPTFDDIVSFKDKFLTSDDNNYTLVISDFTNHFDAYQYIKSNRLLQSAFSYEYINQNGELNTTSKLKTVDVKRNIAYGIFNSEEDAKIAKNDIFDTTNEKKFNVVKVKDIKEQYGKYIAGLETQIEPFIVKPKIKKTFITDQKFKKKFMEAEDYFFTINIVSFSKLKYAEALVKKEGIEKDSFIFRYGRNGEWVKVMYGIFPTYSQAFEALSKHPNMVDKYHPIIEKVEHKQKLFKKYKKYNGLPKWYYEEQKRIKEEEQRKEAEEKAKKEAEEKAAIEANKKVEEEKEKKEKEEALKLKNEKETKEQIEDIETKKQLEEANANNKKVEEVVLDENNEITDDTKIEEVNPTVIQADETEAENKKREEERLAKEKAKAEAKAKKEAEEKARLEAEKIKALEEARKLQERLEKERKAKEAAEAEAKAKKEAEEKARLVAEKIKALEEARKLQERLEKERKAKEAAEAKRLEEERIAKEKAEAKRLEEERLAKQKAEAEAKAKKEAEEKARLEAEKIKALEEARKLQERLEEERKAKEAAEAKRLEEERLAKQKAEAEAKAKKEAEEKARLEAEKIKALEEARKLQKKLEEERKAKEIAEAKRLEEERIAKEKAEAKRLEEERLAKEKAEAEAKAKKEAEEKARLEAEKIKALEEARKLQERLEKERKAKEAEEAKRLEEERLAKQKAEAEAKAKKEAEEKARLEAEKIKALEEARKLQKKLEEERKAKEIAEAKRVKEEKLKALKEAKELKEKLEAQRKKDALLEERKRAIEEARKLKAQLEQQIKNNSLEKE